jgi:hypothetical protein
MQTASRKSLIVSLFAVAAALAGHNASAQSDDVIRWQSIIGIIQANSVVGTGSGAVTGAPGPWSTRGGHVKIDLSSGKVNFDVDGLVLASGNSIGTPGAVTQVKGTLVCDTDGSATGQNSVLVDTPLVSLDEQGEARFNGTVTLPVVCANQPDIAFLVRTAGGKWLANGTVLQ